MKSTLNPAEPNKPVSEADEIVDQILNCDGESIESIEERTALLRKLNRTLSDLPDPLPSKQSTTGPSGHADLQSLADYIRNPQGWLETFVDVRKTWIDAPEDTPVLLRSTYDHTTSFGSRFPSAIAVKEIAVEDLPAVRALLALPQTDREKLGVPEVLSTHTVLGRAEQFDETYFETTATSQKFEIIDVRKADQMRYLKR
jgi:hypothetical protein